MMYFGNHSYKKQAFHVAMVLNGETSAAILGSTYDNTQGFTLDLFSYLQAFVCKKAKRQRPLDSHREGAASNLKLNL